FSFDSMDSQLEGEELKEDNFLKLLNDTGACLPFRVQNKIAGDVLRYVEEVKDDEDKNLEVLIVPGKIAVFKQRAAESFQEHMLGLMDSEGLDYCANTEVLVLVEPAKRSEGASCRERVKIGRREVELRRKVQELFRPR